MNIITIISSIASINHAYTLSFVVMFLTTKSLVKYIRSRNRSYIYIFINILTILYCFLYQYASTRWQVYNISSILPAYEDSLWNTIETIGFFLLGTVHVYLCLIICYRKC